MKTRSLAIATLAIAATLPATAGAAAKHGTYNTQFLTDAAGTELENTSFGISLDRGTVNSLSIKWLCQGDEEPLDRDRETIIVSVATDKASFRVKGNKLTWSGTAKTLHGDLFSDTFDFQEGKAKVKLAGKWKGSTLTGTFSATMGSCTSGPLSYTARRA